MTKKTRILFAVLLVLVMVCTAGCSGKDPAPPQDTTAPTETIDNDTKPVPGFVGAVLYNQDGIKVTVTGYETDNFYGPMLYVKISNSTDKDVVVKSELVCGNFYMMNNTMIHSEVAAGTEAESCFVFSYNEMERCEIKELTLLEFYITVCDPVTNENLAAPKLVRMHLAAEHNISIDASGLRVYDKDGIRIVFKGVEKDRTYQGAVYFFVDNNSGRNISIFNKYIGLNEVYCLDTFWVDVRHDAYALDCIYLWDLSSYKLESLDQIETIALNLQIIDYDTKEEIDTVSINIDN